MSQPRLTSLLQALKNTLHVTDKRPGEEILLMLFLTRDVKVKAMTKDSNYTLIFIHQNDGIKLRLTQRIITK